MPARLRPGTLGRSSKGLITTGCKWVSANARRYERLVHSSAPGQGSMDVGDWCGCGRAVAQRGVRPNPVVGVAPRADHELGFLETGEDLSLQALVPECPTKTLAEPVLPRAPGRNGQGLRPKLGQPCPKSLGAHLRAVVAANRLRNAGAEHRVSQGLQHSEAVDAPLDLQRQALARGRVNER